MAATSAYGDLLNAYILDFLNKRGFQRTARLFIDECRQLTSSPDAAADGDSTRTAASPPSPDASGAELPSLPIESSNSGFLAEWWSVFWEFFAVNSGRRPDGFAPSEAMLTFAQHLTQNKPLPTQLPPGGRRPSLAKYANTNGKRRSSHDELTDNLQPQSLLLPDAAAEQSKRLRVADTEAGSRSPQSAALVAQYLLPDTTDADTYYHQQFLQQQMASQNASGVAAIPQGHGVNISSSGVPMMSENYRDFLAHTLKTVAENNSSNIAPPPSSAANASIDATAITQQEYLPTLLNDSGARTEPNSTTAATHTQKSSSGSPLSQTQHQSTISSQANAIGMALGGGRPTENSFLNQQHLAQQQSQQILGNRPNIPQFASPHMTSTAAPRVVPTQRTKSYQLPPNGSGQPSAAGPPPGAMVPSFVPANSFHAMQRLMSPPAMPLSLPTQTQPLMTPVVGNNQPQGDIRRTPSTSMSFGMQQPGGANSGMQQMGTMTPQLYHPPAPAPPPQAVRQQTATSGFSSNQGNGNAGIISPEMMAAAAAAAGVDPHMYGNVMVAYTQQRQQQMMQQAQQQQLAQQQQMQQIGGGSIVGMDVGKSDVSGSSMAALQQLRAQQNSAPPTEASMQGRPSISLPSQLSSHHQLMMMAKGMTDQAGMQQQQMPQNRYMQQLQQQTPLMGSGAILVPANHSSSTSAMSAAEAAKQAEAANAGPMMGAQSPSEQLSPSAAATAAKKAVPTKPRAKRGPRKKVAGTEPKGQAKASAAAGLSPFMGARQALPGNSDTNSTNASASPGLAIKATGAQAFAGIPQPSDTGLLSSGRLDDSAFSSMLSQRGGNGSSALQAGGSTGLDFDSSMSAFGSLGQSLEDMFRGHQGMDLHLHEFLDMDAGGNSANGGNGDMIDEAMLGYNISDPTSLSSIIGASSAANSNSMLALNLGSLSAAGNNANTSSGGGSDPGALLTLPVNHLT